MNCNPGDLAFIVGVQAGHSSKTAPNEHGIGDFGMMAVDIRGTIVKCIKLYSDDGEWGWEIEPREVSFQGVMNDGRQVSGCGTLTMVPDSVLRPIRGGELGEDVFTTDKLPCECGELTLS